MSLHFLELLTSRDLRDRGMEAAVEHVRGGEPAYMQYPGSLLLSSLVLSCPTTCKLRCLNVPQNILSASPRLRRLAKPLTSPPPPKRDLL